DFVRINREWANREPTGGPRPSAARPIGFPNESPRTRGRLSCFSPEDWRERLRETLSRDSEERLLRGGLVRTLAAVGVGGPGPATAPRAAGRGRAPGPAAAHGEGGRPTRGGVGSDRPRGEQPRQDGLPARPQALACRPAACRWRARSNR